MPIKFEDFIGKRVLIIGEIGSGKTKLLSKYLDYLIASGHASKITLIEMAPAFHDIGRPVEDHTSSVKKVRYLKPEKIFPPRLLGRSSEEIVKYAEHNYRELKRLLEEYARNPTEILLINDLTLFLHAGDPEELLRVIELPATFAATAYEGAELKDDKGSGITRREKMGLNFLKKYMDLIIPLTKA